MTRSLVWYVRVVTIGLLVAAAAGPLWGRTPAIPADPVRLLPLIAIAIISEALIVAEDDHEGGGADGLQAA